MKAFIHIIASGLLLLHTFAYASDLDKEKRWADQIIDSLMDGEAIMLNDGEVDFLALTMPSDPKTKKGVIIMHGIGIHPNWGQIIQPLRIALPEAGWHTLSIQLPVLANGVAPEQYKPLIADAAPRIEAAIAYLTEQGITEISLIAHSLGTQMTVAYLSSHAQSLDKAVKGFIGVSMLDGTVDYLSAIDLPILDIYGDQDNVSSLLSVDNRRKASVNNQGYQQEMVEGANHFFEEREGELLESVIEFLNTL